VAEKLTNTKEANLGKLTPLKKRNRIKGAEGGRPDRGRHVSGSDMSVDGRSY
jgi:hypothetical protein